MYFKKAFERFFIVFLFLLLASPTLAQLIVICRFKGVEIPYKLIVKDTVLEKSKYNLEAVKNPNAPIYYLRVKKGKKVLCLIEGEHLSYDASELPKIPDSPTLKINKNTEERVFYFIVETGKASSFPLCKLRFKMHYED